MVGLGIELAVPVVLFMFAGRWVDRWLESSPWAMLTGLLLGTSVGFYGFFKKVLPAVRGRGESPPGRGNGDGS